MPEFCRKELPGRAVGLALGGTLSIGTTAASPEDVDSFRRSRAR